MGITNDTSWTTAIQQRTPVEGEQVHAERVVRIIRDFLPDNLRKKDTLVEGLRIIMANNYFRFGGKTWHQKDGTAMFTYMTPVYAIVFLGAIEEKIWADHIVLNTRFIDDGFVFVIWKPLTEQYSFNRYLLSTKSAVRVASSRNRGGAHVPNILVDRLSFDTVNNVRERESLSAEVYYSATTLVSHSTTTRLEKRGYDKTKTLTSSVRSYKRRISLFVQSAGKRRKQGRIRATAPVLKILAER